MTWDTLIIPAMSERIFSNALHLVTSLQSSLQDETIEANKCLKSWFTQKSKQKEWVALGAEGRLNSRGKRHGGQIEELWGEKLLQERSNRIGWELQSTRKMFFLILLGSGNKCIPKLAKDAKGASMVRKFWWVDAVRC